MRKTQECQHYRYLLLKQFCPPGPSDGITPISMQTRCSFSQLKDKHKFSWPQLSLLTMTPLPFSLRKNSRLACMCCLHSLSSMLFWIHPTRPLSTNDCHLLTEWTTTWPIPSICSLERFLHVASRPPFSWFSYLFTREISFATFLIPQPLHLGPAQEFLPWTSLHSLP